MMCQISCIQMGKKKKKAEARERRRWYVHMIEFVRSLCISSQREDPYPMLRNGDFPF